MDRSDFIKTTGLFLSGITVSGTGLIGYSEENKINEDHLKMLAPFDEFVSYDALGLAELIKKKDISPTELVEVIIKRIEYINPKINCLATFCFERARKKAQSFDINSTFSGVPILIKDMIDVGGVRRTDGSILMSSNIPQKNVAYIDALEKSGLNILGITTVPEFASGFESELFGKTRNPWDLDYTCLGSSAGAAASVASGILPLAHGTDGGGSNRLPSHACGLFGFKPSRNRMLSGESYGGHDLFKTNNSISRTVRDCAALFNETEDKSSKFFEPIGLVENPIKRKLKIAYAREGVKGFPIQSSIIEEIDEVAKSLENLGHQITIIEHPIDGNEFFDNYRFAFLPKFLPLLDMVKNISGKGATDSKLISYWTSSMIDMASHYKPQEIQAGKNYFAKPENLYGDLFKEYDVLLSAVTPMETPKFGVLSPTDDFKSKGEIFEKVMSLTAPTNAAGCCAMSVPLSRSKRTNMPIGSMFQAKSGDDRLLLELAYQLEEFKPWRDNWAPNSINFKY